MEHSFEKIISEVEDAENNEGKEKNIKEDKDNFELTELTEYMMEIREITKKYNLILLTKPSGEDGRSYDQEFDIFYKKIEKFLDEKHSLSDEQYSDMCPGFTYPKIDELKLEELETARLDLERITEDVENNCKSENVHKIIDETIDSGKAKIDYLIKRKNNNLEEAFNNAKDFYGDANEDLCEKANAVYYEKIEFLKNRPEKDELEKKLESSEFDAQAIKTYFELALIKAGLKESGFVVIVSDGVSSITVRPEECKILIPIDRKVNGKKLLELIAHEIGRHVATNFYNKKQGFDSDLGKDWEIYSEGIAKISETRIKKEVFGDSYSDFEFDFEIYYVLAIEKIKEGWNYAKVFHYIYNKVLAEKLLENKYGDLEEKDEELDKKLFEIKKKSKDEAKDISDKICMRVFRGFDPKIGGFYLPKDKVYFEGKIKALELEEMRLSKDKKETEQSRKIEKYLTMVKADPSLIAHLIKMGAYSYGKGIEAARTVAKIIWKEKGWPTELLENDDWYKENTRFDLFMPYMSQFMDNYYEEEWHDLYDTKKENNNE
ncbi:MAG: DUF1704 domain-containing protein [Patescibacteria group bacterium]|nr:DUF1704 domain-containing protein [Patescibacteria group bacterium]